MAELGMLGFGLGVNGTIFLKVVLSRLTPQETGTGTGTYGLFRDLAAPFGVAVFVPLFTNQITTKLAAAHRLPLQQLILSILCHWQKSSVLHWELLWYCFY